MAGLRITDGVWSAIDRFSSTPPPPCLTAPLLDS